MQKLAPIFIILLALVTLGFLFFGEDSYARISSLNNAIEQQKQKNLELKDKVDQLKEDIHGLQNNPRELEKAARNELGMARPNELIYMFEKGKGASSAR